MCVKLWSTCRFWGPHIQGGRKVIKVRAPPNCIFWLIIVTISQDIIIRTAFLQAAWKTTLASTVLNTGRLPMESNVRRLCPNYFVSVSLVRVTRNIRKQPVFKTRKKVRPCNTRNVRPLFHCLCHRLVDLIEPLHKTEGSRKVRSMTKKDRQHR